MRILKCLFIKDNAFEIIIFDHERDHQIYTIIIFFVDLNTNNVRQDQCIKNTLVRRIEQN